MWDVARVREKDAKELAAFYTGKSEKHPHGLSGRRWIVPPEDGKRCWDTAPHAFAYSEWGNAAGAV